MVLTRYKCDIFATSTCRLAAWLTQWLNVRVTKRVVPGSGHSRVYFVFFWHTPFRFVSTKISEQNVFSVQNEQILILVIGYPIISVAVQIYRTSLISSTKSSPNIQNIGHLIYSSCKIIQNIARLIYNNCQITFKKLLISSTKVVDLYRTLIISSKNKSSQIIQNIDHHIYMSSQIIQNIDNLI